MERNADVFKDEERTREAIRDIADLRLTGLSFKKIAELYDVGYWVIFFHYSRALEKDCCGYDPLDRNRLEELLSDAALTFREAAYLMKVPPEGLRNYITDRDVPYRVLPKPATFDASSFTADNPVLEEFLRTKRVTAAFCAYYGYSFPSAKNWAKACGIPLRKSTDADEKKRVAKLPELPSMEDVELCVKDLVDLRCEGRSFSEIARSYGITKAHLYSRYNQMRKNGYDGYEPYDVTEIREALLGEDSFAEIAMRFGLRTGGLRNYIQDRDIYGRTLPFYEEIIRENASKEVRIRMAVSYLNGEIPMAALSRWFGLGLDACQMWAAKTMCRWHSDQEKGEI